MGVKVNIEKTISDFKEKGGNTKFLPSLKNVLTFVKNDQNINKIEHLNLEMFHKSNYKTFEL